MADSSINFDKAEKFSYAYVDGKYAKIATVASAGSSVVMADPLSWGYAETHSYVKVDPSSLGVQVPDDVEQLYAKVIYIEGGAGGSGSSGSGSAGTITVQADPEFGRVSATFATTGYVDQKIRQAVTAIEDDLEDYAAVSAMEQKIGQAVAGIEDDLANYATVSSVEQKISQSAANMEAELGDYATLQGMDTAVSGALSDAKLYTDGMAEDIHAELEDYYTSGQVEDRISGAVSSAVGAAKAMTEELSACIAQEYCGKQQIETRVSGIMNLINDLNSRIVSICQTIQAIGNRNSETQVVNDTGQRVGEGYEIDGGSRAE